MTRLATSIVLGYHGCDRAVGRRLLAGEPFRKSTNNYDWLGSGVYFWEANPLRALQFAREVHLRSLHVKDPFVVGALIDLRHCLDLTTTAAIELLKGCFVKLVEARRREGKALTLNSPNRMLRRLDCEVVNSVNQFLGHEGQAPIDTVRGLFTEGDPIYPTSGFYEKTHIQIAVRNPACIRGVFRVPEDQLRMPELAVRIARARKASTN